MYQLVITFIFVSIPLMSDYVIDNSQDVVSQINTTRYPKHVSMNSLWFFLWQIIGSGIILLRSPSPYSYYRSMPNYGQDIRRSMSADHQTINRLLLEDHIHQVSLLLSPMKQVKECPIIMTISSWPDRDKVSVYLWWRLA